MNSDRATSNLTAIQHQVIVLATDLGRKNKLNKCISTAELHFSVLRSIVKQIANKQLLKKKMLQLCFISAFSGILQESDKRLKELNGKTFPIELRWVYQILWFGK